MKLLKYLYLQKRLRLCMNAQTFPHLHGFRQAEGEWTEWLCQQASGVAVAVAVVAAAVAAVLAHRCVWVWVTSQIQRDVSVRVCSRCLNTAGTGSPQAVEVGGASKAVPGWHETVWIRRVMLLFLPRLDELCVFLKKKSSKLARTSSIPKFLTIHKDI